MKDQMKIKVTSESTVLCGFNVCVMDQPTNQRTDMTYKIYDKCYILTDFTLDLKKKI